MEQTIKINVPEGKVAKYNETNQTIEFIDKEPIRSKSWKEFCENHPRISYEYYLQQSVTMVVSPTIETRINFRHSSNGEQSKCLLKSKEDAEGILALIQLTRLHDEWVGDWNPRWDTCTEKKYIIINYGGDIIVAWDFHRKCTLAFPTDEMAIEFLDCFKDLIEKAKKFI